MAQGLYISISVLIDVSFLFFNIESINKFSEIHQTTISEQWLAQMLPTFAVKLQISAMMLVCVKVGVDMKKL